jgi:hypothetical protein
VVGANRKPVLRRPTSKVQGCAPIGSSISRKASSSRPQLERSDRSVDSDMPYISGLVHNVFILRWNGAELGDAASLMDRVRDARNGLRSPVVYVAIVPAGDRTPDMPTRLELARQLKELTELCACVHLVLEGDGFRAAAQRAVATSMFLMTGRHGRVTAHGTLAEALNGCHNLSAPAADILASRLGVLAG